MRYGTLIGWGIVIYAVMFLTWNELIAYGFFEGIVPRITSLIVLVSTLVIVGRALRIDSWVGILPYSVGWACMMILFDAIFTVPGAGWGLYLDPDVLLGYALVALIPLLSPVLRFWFR